MWELISFHAVFMVCVIAYAGEASVRRKAQRIRTYPFEAFPHYHSSSLCQNYFTVCPEALPHYITRDFGFICNS